MADKEKKKAPGREASKGYALLAAPDDVCSCSHDGEEFEVDADGLVEVPVKSVAALQEHGFKAV